MSHRLWPRRDALFALTAAAWSGAAVAQAPDPAAPPTDPAAPPEIDEATLTLEELVTLDLGEDDVRRMKVPVMVEGRGPFPFVVDTGADHSVVSVELARLLGVPSAGLVRVNGIAGSLIAGRGRVGRLEVGGRKLEGAALPLLPRRHLGALGLVGLDCLTNQRLDIDFGRRKMEVRRSRGYTWDPNAIVVRGKSRFGKLILVDSTVRREPVYVVLDSGAQDSVGNDALRMLVDRRRRAGTPPNPLKVVELRSVTGQTVAGEMDQMSELTLGGVRLSEVPLVYSELHTFKSYKLDAEPALMLGMNTLRSFAKVGVDFGRREVTFHLPGGTSVLA